MKISLSGELLKDAAGKQNNMVSEVAGGNVSVEEW